MAWSVDYDEALRLVVLTYSGQTTGQDIKDAAAARIAMGRKRGVTDFLIDTRDVLVDESATVDIYDVPDKMYVDKAVQRVSRIAILEPRSPDSRHLVEFFANACTNRGWLAKRFTDRTEALEWLHEEQSP